MMTRTVAGVPLSWLLNPQMAGVIADHLCTTMTIAGETEAKMMASLAIKDRRVWFCFTRLYIRCIITMYLFEIFLETI